MRFSLAALYVTLDSVICVYCRVILPEAPTMTILILKAAKARRFYRLLDPITLISRTFVEMCFSGRLSLA